MVRPAGSSCVRAALCGVLLSTTIGGLRAQEQYPPPLKHTPANHPADHVVIIDVAGLHARDLDYWVRTHPDSALAALSARGDTFTNTWLPVDDPVVGLLALATAGTPISTDVPASTFFARDLSPVAGDCRASGAIVYLSGPPASGNIIARDPARSCAPLQPHQLLRFNTIFDLVHARGGRTAWAGDDERTIDLLRGREGTGLSETVVYPSDRDAPAADEQRVAIMKRWMDGKAAATDADVSVPTLMGVTLSAFGEAQRTAVAYADGTGKLTPRAEEALHEIDQQIAVLVRSLQSGDLFDRTWVLVTATQLLAPADDRARRHVKTDSIRQVLKQGGIPVAALSTSGGCLVWLRDSRQAQAAANILWRARARLGIAGIRTANDLALTAYGSSARAPDLTLEPENGVLWDVPSESAARGGTPEDTRHVAMLVSGVQLGHRSDPTPVPTTQAAALLLRALGLEKLDLEAQHHEHAPALPGIF